MIRVDEDNLCPICNHSDWCLIAENGSAAICARISDGSVKQCGSAGWLHILSGDFKPVKQKKRKPIPINWSLVQKIYVNNTVPIPNWFYSAPVLYRMGLGWCDDSWTIPIFDGQQRIIGMSRRFMDGSKKFVRGSCHGVYALTEKPKPKGTLLICEGYTDTATAIGLGYKAIGRTSCNTSEDVIEDWLAHIYYDRIYIISDNDEHGAGQRGADKLAKRLFNLKLPLKSIIIPPVKDLREWYDRGLTKEELEKLL